MTVAYLILDILHVSDDFLEEIVVSVQLLLFEVSRNALVFVNLTDLAQSSIKRLS